MEVLGWVGTVLGSLMVASPLKAVSEWKTNKSVGNMSFVPFATLWCCCVTYILYGILIGSMAVVATNSIGIVASTYTIAIYTSTVFQEHGKGSEHARRVVWIIIGSVGFAAVFVMASQRMEAKYTGMAAMSCAIAMYGAPLVQIQHILRTKSAEVLVPAFIVTTLGNTAVWMTYGFLSNDQYIAVPNLFGIVFAGIQAVLYFKYKSKASI